MPKPIYRYNVQFGLAGCYMPDTNDGPYIGTTRREFVAMIKEQLDMYDFPKSYIRKIPVNGLWDDIKRWGSSSLHFSIDYKSFTLQFCGLTEEEAEIMEKEYGY